MTTIQDAMTAVLRAHWTASTHTENKPFVDKCDGCGEVIFSWVDPTVGTGHERLAAHQAEALTAAGFLKMDHTEYALDHKLSDLQFTDDDGELWTDEDDVKDYADEYGDTAPLKQRHVTAWEPIK